MEKAQKNFGKRLHKALVAAGYEPKPAVLEREFNLKWDGMKPMTLHGVRRWLMGETIPGDDKIQVLAKWLKVEPQTLRFGEQSPRKIREDKAQWNIAIKHTERETFEAFLALPTPHKKLVREMITALAKTKG
jgi:hypothetical protein